MSVESAKSFVERIKTDSAFKQQLANAPDNEARRKIVSEAGYNFTKEDILQLPNELTDEELNRVSGGDCDYCDSGKIGGVFCMFWD